ncbi:unnamed protein product [Polarella glacialis]|uniref:Uncharacterized protein n=1 Tax=Polarella glacialis TaxID=89957 RepID=A0A813HW29_POLGL|nr:unnamed protein product [Polarella glacialis]
MAMLRLGGFGDAMDTMKGEKIYEDWGARILMRFEAVLEVYQLAFVERQKVIEEEVLPMLRTRYQDAGGVGLSQGGLPGGCGGATSAGGAGSSIGNEVKSEAREAEKVRGEDENKKGKVESRNGLGNCCFSVRNTVNEEKLKDKFEAVDKEKNEVENKQKDIEGDVYPMLKKEYQAAGGVGLPEAGLPGGCRGATSAGGAGSSIGDEVKSEAREAEKDRGEDETNRVKVESRNGLAKCCFTIRNTVNEEKLKDQFEVVDKEEDESENAQKEIEGDVYPMLKKEYQAAGGVGLPEAGLPGGCRGATSAGGAGSSIGDEVKSVAREAEKDRGEDETNRGKVESRNGLAKCCFTIRNAVNEENLKTTPSRSLVAWPEGRLPGSAKSEEKLRDEAVEEEKDEYESQQKEIEGGAHPVKRKGYKAAGGAGVPQGGLSGGCAGAADAGGFGSSTVKEANSEAREAEKVKNEDETSKGKIESRNGSVRYCLTMRNTLAFYRRPKVQVRGGWAGLAGACATGFW